MVSISFRKLKLTQMVQVGRFGFLPIVSCGGEMPRFQDAAADLEWRFHDCSVEELRSHQDIFFRVSSNALRAFCELQNGL